MSPGTARAARAVAARLEKLKERRLISLSHKIN